MNWIYLSKNGIDEYMQMFAAGSGGAVTALERFDYDAAPDPLVLRGIMKHKIIKRCWQDHRLFRYMDTGYLGNRPGPRNPNGWKFYHRIVHNNLQHDQVIPRPADRWQQLGLKMRPPQRHSRTIMIAAPDEKPCAFYGITLLAWLEQTIAEIRKHTDRPIQIRQRPVARTDRKQQAAEEWLNDVHALVTFNSVAATESVLAGVPVFVLAPCNAARPMANLDLSCIEDPWFPDSDQVHAWACHLAYGQFHTTELADGTAARILDQTKEMLNA